MSQRQRRRKDERRKRGQRHGPSKRQLAAGATLTIGATLTAGASAQAADYTVTNLGDAGPGTLRQAIIDANNNPGADRVLFASSLSGTITLTSSLLEIFDPVQVLGPGAGQITVSGNNSTLVFGVYPHINGNAGDPVTISGLTITGGRTDVNGGGGGIVSVNASLTVSDAVITGNHAGEDGGGIFVYGGAANPGSLTLRNSTLSGNSAGENGADDDAYGGGVYATSTPMTVVNTTVSGNTAGGDGGGIYTTQASAADAANPTAVSNSTISGNSTLGVETSDDAGGLWLCCGEFGEQMTLDSSTISGNSTTSYGGGAVAFVQDGSQVQINNTILANNSASNGPGPDLHSDPTAQLGFSLVENPAEVTPGPPLVQTGPNIFGVDPQLGPLAFNGGPTQTHALAETSPAFDTGNTSLTSDQRGSTRPFDFASGANAPGGNGADIGAFELAPNCQGRAATIVARAGQTTVGTPKADVIVGTDLRDVIRAGTGNDRVCARSGNDKVAGEKGKDRLNGDAGKDRIGGGAGKDTAKGGKGKDRLSGAAGNDKLVGGKAADKLKGGKGNDKLKGGPGRDKLIGGPGTDKLAGGAGKDTQKQ
jgi:predicted outer membrane repeat protein